MGYYVLKGTYSDMGVVVLGKTMKSIQKKLTEHFEYVLDEPEQYEKKYIELVTRLTTAKYKSVDELMKDYNKNANNDYWFEEAS